MAVTHKISYNVPRSTMSSAAMPVFKRVRIERWCAEVAKHMRAGSLCQSVIGHVLEEPPVDLHIATDPAFPVPDHPSDTAPDLSDLHLKSLPSNASTQLTPREGWTTPVPGRRLSPAPAPLCFSFSFRTPAHAQYLDQRRKVDRLVQGLPVKPTARSTRGRSAAAARDERLISTGEDVVRLGEVTPLPPRQQRAAADHPGPARPRPRCRPTSEDVSRFRGQSASPAAIPARSSAQQGVVSSYGLVSSSEVTVIEDDDVRRWQGNSPCARGEFRTGSGTVVGKTHTGQTARQRLSASAWNQMTHRVRHSASPCKTTSP